MIEQNSNRLADLIDLSSNYYINTIYMCEGNWKSPNGRAQPPAEHREAGRLQRMVGWRMHTLTLQTQHFICQVTNLIRHISQLFTILRVMFLIG